MFTEIPMEEFFNRMENAFIQAFTKYTDSLLLQKIETPKKGLVKIDEVMTTLKVSKPTVYNWIKRGIIKSHKIGKRTFFNMDEIFMQLKYNPSVFRNTDKFTEPLKEFKR